MSTADIQIGHCNVSFAGADLGHTKEGVLVTYEPTYQDITVDAYGSTPVEKVLIGESLKAEVTLAEYSVNNLAVAMPTSTEDGSNITLGRTSGFRLSTVAGVLVLHPSSNVVGDRSEDVVFFKAVASDPIELPYKIDGERAYKVVFTAMIDETQTDGSYLGLIGDTAN